MAKRKDLKKLINYVCGELYTNAVIAHLINKEKMTAEAADDIIDAVAALRKEYIARISHTEKGNERKFYVTLRKEFEEKVNLLIDQIAPRD